MPNEDALKDRWTEILAHKLRTGELQPIIEWLFRRIHDPAVRAWVDTLAASHSEKVLAAITRVVQESNANGTVSEEAILEFSRNAWWLPEVVPILPPNLRKVAQTLRLDPDGACLRR